GNAYWGFDYDTAGRVIGIRQPPVIDAYLAGYRADWAALDTEITYDTSDRASTITAPAPLASTDRPARTYTYAPAFDSDGQLTSGTLAVARAGVAGTYRTIAYDSEGKITADTDPSGRVTTLTYDEDLDAPS